ncbi:MAG TPA: BatA domain-containing protein [Gemmataceae bacterium]|nr:BatA domain-containing protein [Gemmataceae bacterium]
MHPILIAGAALVGLPIILHLIMKQEPKRLPFPAFRFLKQKLKTNQRKLRLRHFILLALRMLLIALFCLTLFQPTLLSERFNIRGDQPIAVVIVIDTSPSMGYMVGDKSRLDEAKRRALELLDELPENSLVAVIDTGDPNSQPSDADDPTDRFAGIWLRSVPDARKRINGLKEPTGRRSVTDAIGEAYSLCATADKESDGDPYPKLIAIFTDRTTASWDPARAEELKKAWGQLPDPKPAHAVVDVGVDRPADVAILGASMSPQVIPGNTQAVVTVTIRATGPGADATVLAYLDGAATPLRSPVTLAGGQTQSRTFTFKDLTPGLHQVRFKLETPDSLTADDERFLTFKVAEPRRVLTITDNPGDPANGVRGDAFYWALAMDANNYLCDVVAPAKLVTDKDGRVAVAVPGEAEPRDLSQYDVVCLLAVAHPNQPAGDPLWGKLRRYCLGGGKLAVIPGGEGDDRTALGEYTVDASQDLLPGSLKGVLNSNREGVPEQTAPGWDEKRPPRDGVTWLLDDEALTNPHPMLAPVAEWKRKGGVDFLQNPRRAWKYWDVEKHTDALTVAAYHDSADPKACRPAVLDRPVIDPKDKAVKGRVILLTTRLEYGLDESQEWNDYWKLGNSWVVVFPDLVIKYLVGELADAVLNYQTGQTVTMSLAKLPAGKRENLILEGPRVEGRDAIVPLGEQQTELKLGPPRTLFAGNFTVTLPGRPNPEPPRWRDGFSLNPPAEEFALDKVSVEVIEGLTGPNSVVPVERDLKLWDAMERKFNQPVDLFPWLLILVLMLLVLEGFVANRFYRRPTPGKS